jgi:lipoprotein-anchoring transpeptidase ErfK/SrfK
VQHRDWQYVGFGGLALVGGFVLWALLFSPAVRNVGATAQSAIAGLVDGESLASLFPAPVPTQYIEVVDGCGPYFDGACLNARSRPSTEAAVIKTLRTGMVLKFAEKLSADGQEWYRVVFDEWLRFPERHDGDWYVSAAYVREIPDVHAEEASKDTVTSTQKRILVDRSDQTLYAYEGETLFMEQAISTGLELTPTPRGVFTVYRKTPSRYMQGPIEGISDQEYDLPGVPWNLYFSAEGAVIHGAYWHDHFGEQWSHGCVNLPPAKAKELYLWAPIGITVTVRD